MKVLRVNGTVDVSAGVLRDSTRTVVDTHCHSRPFAIPVSQLLRIEKRRGYEHQQSTNNTFNVRAFHSSARTKRPRVKSCHQDGSIGSTTAALGAHLNIPYSRSKSSKKPPPPPPLPPRRPRRPDRSAVVSHEDDVLFNIPVITGAEDDRLQERKREKSLVIQIKEDAMWAPWHNDASALDSKLALSANAINRLHSKFINHRTEAREYCEYLVKKRDRMIAALQNRIEALATEIVAVRDEHHSEAREQGRLDFKVRKSLVARFRKDMFSEADEIAAGNYSLRRAVAEQMYTRDWVYWKYKRDAILAKEATKASHALKHDGSMQSEARRRTDDIDNAYENLSELLDELDKHLISRKQPMSRNQAEHHVGIFVLGLEIASFSHNISPLGHDWRKLDHYALLESRWTWLTDHLSADVKAREIISRAREDMKLIGHAFAKLVEVPMMSVLDQSRLAIYLSMRTIFQTYNDLFVPIADQYLEFLRDGCFMLNPAMRSDHGRAKYAFLRPFAMFSNSMLSTQKVLRDGRDVIKKLREWTDRDALQSQSDPALKQSSDLYRAYDQAHKYAKSHVRPILGAIDAVMFTECARPSMINDNFLLDKLSQEAHDAKTQLLEERAVQDLSSLTDYTDHTYTESQVDPLSVIGKKELYPPGRHYPVELVSSNRATHEALQMLLLESVVGIDVFHRADISQKGAFVSIATTEKVVIIDLGTWSRSGLRALGQNQVLFTKLLESEDILKVVHSIYAIRPYLTSRNIYPRNIVSLTEARAKKTSSLPRITSGTWKVPRHTFDNQHVMPFITDLAFLSVYNLWTFLLKVPSKSVDSLGQKATNRTHIREAQKRLLHKTSMLGQDLATELGPLIVEKDGSLTRLMARFNTSLWADSNTVRVARLAAKIKRALKPQTESETQTPFHLADEDDITAYYMFTSMGQDLPSIERMLDRTSIASNILRLAKSYNLTLHIKDREKLELAEQEKLRGLKSISSSIGPDAITSSKTPLVEQPQSDVDSSSQARLLRARERNTRRKESRAKQKLRERKELDGLSQQCSNSQTLVTTEHILPKQESKVGSTYSPLKLISKPEQVEPKSVRTFAKKSPPTKRLGKPKLQLKVQKSPTRFVKTQSKLSTKKQSLVIQADSKGEGSVNLVALSPKIVAGQVKNVLSASTHKPVGRSGAARRNRLQPVWRTVQHGLDNSEKETSLISVVAPREEESKAERSMRRTSTLIRSVQSDSKIEHNSKGARAVLTEISSAKPNGKLAADKGKLKSTTSSNRGKKVPSGSGVRRIVLSRDGSGGSKE